jgi:rhodanese-related sulfurtransferase/DNA-binding transcriptional ArsR family regulator
MDADRATKDQLHEQFARIAKAMASPRRLEVLELLAQGEKPVETIAQQAGLTVKNASAHLRELRAARLVETRRDGTWIYYRLASDRVFRVLREIQALARERLAEVEQVSRFYFGARDDLEPITADELRRRLRDGDVTLLDVRPGEEYRAGHIGGALSIPVAELKARMSELQPGTEVVAYCRGPYCVYAADAVAALRAAGFRARRMEEGVPDWRARGYPVSPGTQGEHRRER